MLFRSPRPRPSSTLWVGPGNEANFYLETQFSLLHYMFLCIYTSTVSGSVVTIFLIAITTLPITLISAVCCWRHRKIYNQQVRALLHRRMILPVSIVTALGLLPCPLPRVNITHNKMVHIIVGQVGVLATSIQSIRSSTIQIFLLYTKVVHDTALMCKRNI